MNDEVFNVARAAYFLGIKESKIYSLVKLNKIPFFRDGGLLRFDKEALTEWKIKEFEKNNTLSGLKKELRNLLRAMKLKKSNIKKMQDVINRMKILTKEE